MSLRKYSVTIGGSFHTSISLEPEFWQALKDRAKRNGNILGVEVDNIKKLITPNDNLSSAIRVSLFLEAQVMSKHMPGPWTIEEYGDDESPALVIHRDSERRICFMATPGSHGDPAQIVADAHLIIAAPDLLDAATLLEAAESSRDGCEECDGEGEPEACGKCFPMFDDARVKRRLAIAKALSIIPTDQEKS
jgi:predicted DNA-binding ribbon-helix-helix protein